MRPLAIIGLDCVPPALAFERFAGHMPHLTALRERGVWGPLHSSFPPITVPAWTCMVSGRDPGELGLYGFRDRVEGSYALRTVDARDVAVPRIWDVLSERGLHVSTVAVPPSFPVQPVNGEQVGCFLTPSAEAEHTHPPHLKGQLQVRFGPYQPDVPNVRTHAREGLLAELMAGSQKRFDIAAYLWEQREPDFLMLVDIAPDRLHHAFWADLDPAHPAHDPSGPFVDAGERFYAHLDAQLGRLLEVLGPAANVMVASDHGARPLLGAFRINEWLLQHGYLVLRERPEQSTPLRPELVDWGRTRAWAEGGYYARVFLNRQGREPSGIVTAEQVPALLTALQDGLGGVAGADGAPWVNRVRRPDELYREVRGQAPDLLAVFDELSVRPVATVGGDANLYAEGDDRGPDGCNHDWQGIFVASGPDVSARGQVSDAQLFDVGASAFALLGQSPPPGWLGVDRTGATS